MSALPPALEGTTVLDFATVGPAARCTRILADYGARVVKIGAPPKQGGVQIEPQFFAYAGGRGMKRVKLDLKAPEGKAAFLKLAERADVVVESFRPGVVKRLGIGWDAVRAVNPRVVYCSTSGYGQDGPAASWAGHDLNYLAMGGYLAQSGPRADGGPPLPGATIADGAAGGMHAALAILAALLRRARTGEGEYLDVAVADGVLSLLALAIDEHLATGAGVGPGPRHPDRPLRVLRRLPLPRRPLGLGRRDRAGRSTRTCVARSGSRTGSRGRPTTPRRRASARPSRARSPSATATSGSRSSRPPTPASRRSTRWTSS